GSQRDIGLSDGGGRSRLVRGSGVAFGWGIRRRSLECDCAEISRPEARRTKATQTPQTSPLPCGAFMRWSQAHIPTLREAPADAEAVSHRLLVRAGFIRQLAAGSYTMLPLGQRTRLKVERIIREEMDAIGAQEMLLPTLHPAEIWKKSGRYDLMGHNLYRLKDRQDTDLVLGMTDEEIFALLATELFSDRDLPLIWYQMHLKCRDEPRPKSGLLRVREFTLKDSYTLDLDQAGLDVGFEKHRTAYKRIFARLGLSA